MKHALLFSMIASACLYLAIAHRGLAWCLAWPAVSFFAVAVAYAFDAPAVFGKDNEGRIEAWEWMLLLPFLALTWGVWRCICAIATENPVDELMPGVFIGRRPLRHELCEEWTIFDLTAEFPAYSSAVVRQYFTFPILDATAISAVHLLTLTRHIAISPTPVLIHCAQGHGRTGMVAAAVLLERGVAATAEEAIRIVASRRPGISLSHGQRRAVEDFAAMLRAAP